MRLQNFKFDKLKMNENNIQERRQGMKLRVWSEADILITKN